MSKKVKTYVAIVLDRSGSMHTISEEAVEGYNTHIKKFKENTEEQDVEVSLVTFNSEVYEHYWLDNAKNVEMANQADYNPGGTTAMLDAMGYTIDKLQESTDVANEDNAYLVITISDGCENASNHVDRNRLAQKIATLQATGRWTFTFMGCDGSYLREFAQTTGIPMANMAMFSTGSKEAAKFGYANSASSADKYLKHRVRAAKAIHSGIRGQSVGTCNFYSDDSAMCADYTAPVGDAVDMNAPLWVGGSVSCSSNTPTSFGSAKLESKTDTGTANIFSSGKNVAWKS